MALRLALLVQIVLLAVIFFGENQAASASKSTEEAKRTSRQSPYDAINIPSRIERPDANLYYQHASSRHDDSGSERHHLNRNVLKNYLARDNSYGDSQSQQGRLNLGSLIDLLYPNAQPLDSLLPSNSLPGIIPNPSVPSSASKFDSCTSPNGETGVCAPSGVCNNVFGGRPSGSCDQGQICCISTATACGSTVTLNNTYWQSPVNQVIAPSTCAVTVRLDSRFAEQKRPICQIRLDFVSFNIAQPSTESVCSTDSFQVGGAINRVPTICGDNSGQHMYINIPDSSLTPSNLQLIFSFGSTTSVRSWNIRISFLPCGANYLAPPDCLQYFSSASGTIRSFNWIDAAGSATRQLANQDYSICFRNEIINNQRASSICYSVCTYVRRPFSLSAVPQPASSYYSGIQPTATAAPYVSQLKTSNCNNDFLVIPGGFDPAVSVGPDNVSDRFCGEILNVAANATTNAQVCSTGRPFSVLYRTNGDETATPTADSADRGNAGLCLTFTQRT